MDAEVNDFLNEINEIAPLSNEKPENVWEKCFDEETGYDYYWNTKTNEVTWKMPPEYECNSKTGSKKPANLYIPPKTTPLFPSVPLSDTVKIYKIGNCTDVAGKTNVEASAKSENVPQLKEKITKNLKPVEKEASTNDKRLVLISSYGSDSDDEGSLTTEKTDDITKQPCSPTSKHKTTVTKQPNKPIANTIEIPPIPKAQIDKPLVKNSTGLSLLAGYSDSEDDAEVESINTSKPDETKVSHSTLFPIPQPIDVKDFEPPKPPEEGFDSKAFQRKRRIAVALVNTVKKPKPRDDDNDRKGLGFSTDNNDIGETPPSSIYPGFKSGGVIFVKTDANSPKIETDAEVIDEKAVKVSEDVLETYVTLKEKLDFLGEGHQKILPVQVMLIQLETLYVAMNSGDLKQSYLRKWLEENCSDLVKLEKESAPEGWLLQWDRTHKRYYYQNATTSESQWEYPQVDVIGRDDAMDISTTPPPNGTDATIHVSPPLPPVIRSPSPPPPPTISDFKASRKRKFDIPLPVNPKEVVSVAKCDDTVQPLPPGVDPLEASSKEVPKDMNDALSSFYSDIAAIETTKSPISSTNEDMKGENGGENMLDVTKKKKKTKVKLAQGISMKKKGVSKLVEKWKNVQKSYND